MLEIQTKPIVNLINVLRDLQFTEWKQLGLKAPENGQVINLPDGNEDIYFRLFDVISNSRFGNQIFSNDSLFIFVFPSINGETMSEDLQKLYDYCKDAIVEEHLYFQVSW